MARVPIFPPLCLSGFHPAASTHGSALLLHLLGDEAHEAPSQRHVRAGSRAKRGTGASRLPMLPLMAEFWLTPF
jgi:hypothetical protein